MATIKKMVKKEDTPKKDTAKKKTNAKKKEELIDTTTEKEDVKKTTTKKTATKTNGSKTTKTNNTKKTEEPSVVDEFLDTVVGETMTQEDAENNENRKKEIKERWEKLGMDEGMQEEVKEIVADMYAKQAAELIKEAEENEPECLHHIDAEEEPTEILTQQINAEAAKLSPGIDTDETDYEKEVLDDFNKEVDKYCEESRQEIVGELFKLGMNANVSALEKKSDKIEINSEDKFKELFDKINELATKGPESKRERNVNLDDLKCNVNNDEEKVKPNNKQLNKLSIVYVNSAMGASWD